MIRSLLSTEPYNIVEALGKRVACKGTILVVYRKTFIPRMHDYLGMCMQAVGIFYVSSLHDDHFNDDKLVDAIVVHGC